MARTIRRKSYGKIENARREVWAREDEALGRGAPIANPMMERRWNADWRVFTDAWGSDSKKKGEPIKTHRRSVRRFVNNTLAVGCEPLVLNDKQSWYCCDGAEGIIIPIEET